MKKYTCIITDDEPLARKVIQNYINELQDFEVIAQCKNAIETQELLSKTNVDILLLDIQMPKLSGIDLLKILAPRPLVIFTTASPVYAVDAFELEAFDYLVKPISFERFIRSMNKVKRRLEEKLIDDSYQQYINIKEGKRIYKVKLKDIYILQAFGDYVRIHTDEKIYISKITLQVFLESMPASILQIHRSYAINLEKIDFIEGNQVCINGQKIPISKAYKDLLIDRM